jgi:hypothetical protein
MPERIVAKPNSSVQSIHGDDNINAGRDVNITNNFPQQDLQLKALMEAY